MPPATHLGEPVSWEIEMHGSTRWFRWKITLPYVAVRWIAGVVIAALGWGTIVTTVNAVTDDQPPTTVPVTTTTLPEAAGPTTTTEPLLLFPFADPCAC